MEARAETITDNGHDPISQFGMLEGRMRNIELENVRTALTYEIGKTHTHIDAVEERLNARIDVVAEQIKSTRNELTEQIKSTNARIDSLDTSLNTRIDSLDTSLNTRIDATNTRIDATNTRIDDMKTIVEKIDKRISKTRVIFGIAFAGLFALLGVILSKLG